MFIQHRSLIFSELMKTQTVIFMMLDYFPTVFLREGGSELNSYVCCCTKGPLGRFAQSQYTALILT